MGKEEHLHLQQRTGRHGTSTAISTDPSSSSGFLLCQTCSMGLSRFFSRQFSFRCVFVLILSLFLLVSAIFWIFPSHKLLRVNGFDAAATVKLSASAQGFFRLQKPISQLLPHIRRLEYDIFEEIGVPETKVLLLSMHEADVSNSTDVIFGVLSDPINVPINPVPLSVLRSSLIELFLGQSNLTVTTPIFGQPSGFEILKFSGGITVIPLQYASIWDIPQILFNFTLNNSISEILNNLVELKDQLKFGLHLRPYESVFVQLTNADGSTIASPVVVQASVMSELGILLPQRLKQLAQAITNSPGKNLGLNNSVFGKVKGVVLSSYLQGKIHPTSPTPSPAPSPEMNDYAEPVVSPYPAFSSPSPAPSPGGGSRRSFPPVNSPAPSVMTAYPPHHCSHSAYVTPPTQGSPLPHPNPINHLSPVGSPLQLPPDLSPLPQVSYGSTPEEDPGPAPLYPSTLAPSPLSSAPGPLYGEIWLLFGFLILPCFAH